MSYMLLRYLMGLVAAACGVAVLVRGAGGRRLLGLVPPLMWYLGEHGLRALVLEPFGIAVGGGLATGMAALEIGAAALGLWLVSSTEKRRTSARIQATAEQLNKEQADLDSARRGPHR